MHIAIAGNIGSGKTTLTKMLARHYGWKPNFESVEFNPYLDDFYADMARWSFNLQVYFLNKRFKDVVEISKSNETIIQDRTIFEDARIFAPNLHAQGYMSDRDFANYSDLFDLMISLVKLTSSHRSRSADASTSRPYASTTSKASAPATRTGSRTTRATSSSSTATPASSRPTPRTSAPSPTKSTPTSTASSRKSDVAGTSPARYIYNVRPYI